MIDMMYATYMIHAIQFANTIHSIWYDMRAAFKMILILVHIAYLKLLNYMWSVFQDLCGKYIWSVFYDVCFTSRPACAISRLSQTAFDLVNLPVGWPPSQWWWTPAVVGGSSTSCFCSTIYVCRCIHMYIQYMFIHVICYWLCVDVWG